MNTNIPIENSPTVFPNTNALALLKKAELIFRKQNPGFQRAQRLKQLFDSSSKKEPKLLQQKLRATSLDFPNCSNGSGGTKGPIGLGFTGFFDENPGGPSENQPSGEPFHTITKDTNQYQQTCFETQAPVCEDITQTILNATCGATKGFLLNETYIATREGVTRVFDVSEKLYNSSQKQGKVFAEKARPALAVSESVQHELVSATVFDRAIQHYQILSSYFPRKTRLEEIYNREQLGYDYPEKVQAEMLSKIPTQGNQAMSKQAKPGGWSRTACLTLRVFDSQHHSDCELKINQNNLERQVYRVEPIFIPKPPNRPNGSYRITSFEIFVGLGIFISLVGNRKRLLNIGKTLFQSLKELLSCKKK